MVQLPRSTTIRGPAFIRSLANLGGGELRAHGGGLAARLSEWLDINHAIALSAALDRARTTASSTSADADDALAEGIRIRAELAAAIDRDRAFESGPDAPSDSSFFRQRHLALQQTMEARISELRNKLREQLTQVGAEQARLAAVDAVMERALSRRERGLLARAPVLLSRHFERLQQSAQVIAEAAEGANSPPPPLPATSSAWLDTFRQDMRHTLHAELDVRLYPIEGLLAALRTTS